MICIYTDGSCIGLNNKPGQGYGGWGCVIILPNKIEYHISGNEKFTTNNRMELKSVIEALTFLCGDHHDQNIKIYSDSQLTINCAKRIWKRNKNIDLWDQYDKISRKFPNIEYEWVRGHNGNVYNEIADSLAHNEAAKIRQICIT